MQTAGENINRVQRQRCSSYVSLHALCFLKISVPTTSGMWLKWEWSPVYAGAQRWF